MSFLEGSNERTIGAPEAAPMVPVVRMETISLLRVSHSPLFSVAQLPNALRMVAATMLPMTAAPKIQSASC